MAVPSYFLGSCANTPTPGLSAGQAHAGDFHRVRLFGSWPRKRVHRFDAGSFTAVVLGDCFAAPGESEEILRHGGRPHVVAARMARLAGSHCVIVSRGAEVVVATDLAGLHRVWFRETEGAVEYASTPLALTSASVASVDPEALAARLFCGDFHIGLPGGSLFRGVTEVSPDQLLVLRKGRAELKSRPVETARSTIPAGAQALREALVTGVRERVAGVHTVTADLSGGMDSSSLALLAARSQNSPVRALTYSDPFAVNYDDTGFATRVAEGEPGLTQTLVEGNAAGLPFTEMESVPFTDHPSLDTAIFARTRIRLLPASGASVHLIGDGGDVVLGAPLTYVASLARLGNLRRFAQETRGWARLRHRPVHRVARTAWAVGRMTYTNALTALAGKLAGDPEGRAVGALPRVEDNIAWTWLRQAALWGTPGSRAAVAIRLRQAAEGLTTTETDDGWDGTDAHALRSIRRHTAETRLFMAIAEQLGVRPAAPFFDNQVVAACLSVPAVERVSVTRTKPLLKAALTDDLPGELYERRTKGDYSACEYHGVRRNAAGLRALLKESYLGELGVLRPSLVLAELDRAVNGEHAAMAGICEVVSAEVWLRKLETGPGEVRPAGCSLTLEGH